MTFLKSAFCATTLAGGVVVLLLWNAVQAQQASGVLRDEQFELVSFEDLEYPAIARAARIQGLVVIEARFDDTGSVVSASALSGPPILTEQAVANARKWKFKITGDYEKRVLLGYEFSIDSARCNSGSSLFLLRHKNFASITTCNSLGNAR